MAPIVKLDLPSTFTDGNSELWGKFPGYIFQSTDDLYHKRLAHMWLESTGEAEPGTKYMFKKLPGGYGIHTKPRKNAPSFSDRYILGGPKARYDSPNKFFPHFKWLMAGGVGTCECINCSGKTAPQGRPPKRLPAQAVSIGPAGPLRTALQSSEGDAFEVQLYFDLLRDKELATSTQEEGRLTRVKYQSWESFLPRIGEVVLFYDEVYPDLVFDPTSQTLKMPIRDGQGDVSYEWPRWRAGIVSNYLAQEVDMLANQSNQTPSSIDSITSESRLKFVIDLCMDPDRRDYDRASPTCTVRLSHTRPFNMLEEVLAGLSQDDWHETIVFAAKVLPTVCVAGLPLHTLGQPSMMDLFCESLWVGAELICVNDVVRLLPILDAYGNCQKKSINRVMHITVISLTISLNEHCPPIAYVSGPVYSLDKAEDTAQAPLTEQLLSKLPASMGGYEWYRVKQPNHLVTVNAIAGRCYHRLVMNSLIGADDLDIGRGILALRKWAMANSPRFVDRHGVTGWLFTMDRAHALVVERMNGKQIGRGLLRSLAVHEPLYPDGGERQAYNESEVVSNDEEEASSNDETQQETSMKGVQSGMSHVGSSQQPHNGDESVELSSDAMEDGGGITIISERASESDMGNVGDFMDEMDVDEDEEEMPGAESA